MIEFKCNDCGDIFEKLVEDGTKVECKLCGSGDTEKTLNSPSFKVTGQGAYNRHMVV